MADSFISFWDFSSWRLCALPRFSAISAFLRDLSSSGQFASRRDPGCFALLFPFSQCIAFCCQQCVRSWSGPNRGCKIFFVPRTLKSLGSGSLVAISLLSNMFLWSSLFQPLFFVFSDPTYHQHVARFESRDRSRLLTTSPAAPPISRVDDTYST